MGDDTGRTPTVEGHRPLERLEPVRVMLGQSRGADASAFFAVVEDVGTRYLGVDHLQQQPDTRAVVGPEALVVGAVWLVEQPGLRIPAEGLSPTGTVNGVEVAGEQCLTGALGQDQRQRLTGG